MIDKDNLPMYSIIIHGTDFLVYREFQLIYSVNLYTYDEKHYDFYLDLCCEKLKQILFDDGYLTCLKKREGVPFFFYDDPKRKY